MLDKIVLMFAMTLGAATMCEFCHVFKQILIALN